MTDGLPSPPDPSIYLALLFLSISMSCFSAVAIQLTINSSLNPIVKPVDQPHSA